MNRRIRNRGFTLIELLLVLVILGILMAIVVPKFVGRGDQAKITAAKQDVHNLSAALDTYEVDNSSFPSSQDGLAVLVNQPAGLTGWHGPYVRNVPNDPWGNPYVYRYPGTHNSNSYDLYSTGKGGSDSSGNEINNWTK